MKTLLERIHENFETMGSTDKKISEYILANTEEVPRISIVTLGKNSILQIPQFINMQSD